LKNVHASKPVMQDDFVETRKNAARNVPDGGLELPKRFPKTMSINTLAKMPSPWKYQPHTLISLWDMIEFALRPLLFSIHHLELLQASAMEEAERLGQGAEANEGMKQDLSSALTSFSEACSSIGCFSTAYDATEALWRISGHTLTPGCTYHWIHALIESLINKIQVQSQGLSALLISSERDKLFNKSNAFGESVSNAFPAASFDIKSAGNCLALGMNTAAVFHTMRAAELGIRALAQDRDIGISVVEGKRIQFATIGQIVSRVNQMLPGLRVEAQRSGDSSAQAKLKFMSELLPEIRSFQYAWRDPVMHSRTTFEKIGEAEEIFSHIMKFMQSLADNGIKEI